MPGFRRTMPIAELREKNLATKRTRAVERRREQEGTNKPSNPPKQRGS